MDEPIEPEDDRYEETVVKEKVGFDGKYVDDMESGVVKKLHNLNEVVRKKYWMHTVKDNMVGEQKSDSLPELLKLAKQNNYDTFEIFRNDPNFHSTTQKEYLMFWYDNSNRVLE